MSVVLPGDFIDARPSHQRVLKLGPGLLHLGSSSTSNPLDDPIIATRPGLLKSIDGKQWWVESNTLRYIPAVGESVVGIITTRHADGYKVDIGSAHQAILDGLAFEGATKRSKPNLKVGTLVYARVSLAHRDMEPELECYDPTTHKAEGFGDLKSGYMVSCSLGLARALLTSSHPLLLRIGARFPFEIAIGTNGRVWIKAPSTSQTVSLARAIEWADELMLSRATPITEAEIRRWIDSNVEA